MTGIVLIDIPGVGLEKYLGVAKMFNKCTF